VRHAGQELLNRQPRGIEFARARDWPFVGT
jgi:hypothetical protein